MTYQNPLDPQTEWYTVEQASRMTVRDQSLIRHWVVTGRIDPQHCTKSTDHPQKLLLSPLALLTIIRIPRRRGRKEQA